MTEHEPERWLADPLAEPAVRELLRAGSSERPRARALRAAPAAVAALLAANAAGATTPAVGVAAALGARSGATSALVMKWFAGGVIASVTAVSLTPSPTTHDQHAAATPQRALPALRASAVVERPRLTSLPSASATPEPAPPAVVRPPPSRPDVAREVALLDSARRALADGDARGALDTLSTLERLPSRALVPEATVLQVRALLATNQLAAARRLARRFTERAPSSPQARVLRGLFADELQGSDMSSETPQYDHEIQRGASDSSWSRRP